MAPNLPFLGMPGGASRPPPGHVVRVSPVGGMNRTHESGLTLVEMVVVITVLGMAIAIGVVGTRHMVRSTQLANATTILAGDLRHARALASSQRREFRVVFKTGGYSLVRVATADTVLRRRYPTGVTGTSAPNPATFFAWGMTSPATITITNTERSKVVQLAANGNVTR